MPTVCPKHFVDDHDCRIKNSHRRFRKTGPEFPLFVVVCKEHDIGFTLYPPGFYPYGRQKLAQVSADGSLVVEEDSHRFSDTLFDAALDAAVGDVWHQESTNNSLTPRLTTQNRHLDRIIRLFGIGGDEKPRQREELSQILMIPGQLLHDCTASLQDIISPRLKGKIICRILDKIPFFVNIFERLVEIGAGAGLWPTPLFCKSRGLLQLTPFHPVRTRGAPEKNGDECCHNFIQ